MEGGVIVALVAWAVVATERDAGLVNERSGRAQHVRNNANRCTDEQIQFQVDHYDLVDAFICDSGAMSPWKIVQLLYPNIRTFLDIGGNRGYTAAHFFGLWSPGHGFNRKSLFDALKSDAAKSLLVNNNELNTYCGDGVIDDDPIFCIGRPSPPNNCQSRRAINVYSFDGQKSHVVDSIGIAKRHFPRITPDYTVNPDLSLVKAKWEYFHAALTDVIPPNVTHGYFIFDSAETGRLVKSTETPSNYNTTAVALLTVDKFCQDHKLDYVPVLKIDAEGGDYTVLMGATRTLSHRGVKVINFECSSCMSDAATDVFKMLDNYGFDCYISGKYNLFLRVTNCLNVSAITDGAFQCTEASNAKCPEVIKWRGVSNRRIDGNAFCAHRNRAFTLHAFFESASLHNFVHNTNSGHFHKDAVLSNVDAKFYTHEDGIGIGNDDKIAAYFRHFGRNYYTGEREYQ